ncbi:hypothetical protein [Mesorhizobium sp. B1-1-8]|uniref:hypothetical protein n=1 Tax=Mesorhizobium sp. B1-1-8 TaxID=2589976 RepID=UPI0011274EA7|nr:hypothetical protein [Mesorhizobium sp. B1-1-8]UCI05650.1 hypothetical protein FJ974_17595 [Mesorhizobium sp. B1-1-8]
MARSIVLVLTIKLVGILCMKAFLFPDSAKPLVDASAIERLLGPQQPVPGQEMDKANARI